MRYILTTITLLLYSCVACASVAPADTLYVVEVPVVPVDVSASATAVAAPLERADGQVDASSAAIDSASAVAASALDEAGALSAAAALPPAAPDSIAAGEGRFWAAPTAAVTTRFRPQQLAFPALAIALGGAGVRSHLFDTSRERERLTTIDDQLQYAPLVLYAGLGFIPGVKHSHPIGDRFLAGATAYIVMTAICQGAKRTICEPRPDTGKANSFPSGHTATAFCGAELTRIEYGNAYGAAAYAVAVATGVLRVVNNRHWTNDVLAGAGIGFLSAHVGYWLLPWEKRVVRSIFRRKPAATASSPFLLAPTYEYSTKAPGVAFTMNF